MNRPSLNKFVYMYIYLPAGLLLGSLIAAAYAAWGPWAAVLVAYLLLLVAAAIAVLGSCSEDSHG